MAHRPLRQPLTRGGSPVREIRPPGSVRGAARKGGPYRDTNDNDEGAPAQTGRRKWVSWMKIHRRIEQIPPREESAPGKPIPCAARGDSRGEA